MLRAMLTYIDGAFVEDEKASVNVRSRALNYGLGCFGGVRGYLADDGEQVFVFRLDAHVERLEESAKILYMQLPGSQAEVRDIILELQNRPPQLRFQNLDLPLPVLLVLLKASTVTSNR